MGRFGREWKEEHRQCREGKVEQGRMIPDGIFEGGGGCWALIGYA